MDTYTVLILLMLYKMSLQRMFFCHHPQPPAAWRVRVVALVLALHVFLSSLSVIHVFYIVLLYLFDLRLFLFSGTVAVMQLFSSSSIVSSLCVTLQVKRGTCQCVFYSLKSYYSYRTEFLILF